MKRNITLLTSLIILSLSVNAQKSSWYIGGSGGFSSDQLKWENSAGTTNNGKETSWSFSPEIGTFITDHVSLGIGITVRGQKNDSQTPSGNISKQTNYGATVYSRYFWGKDAFKPFAGINVSVLGGNGKTTAGPNTFESDVFNFGANLNAGFSYALSKRVTTIGSLGFLGYDLSTSKQKGTDIKSKFTSFGFDVSSLGERFNVGIYYTL